MKPLKYSSPRRSRPEDGFAFIGLGAVILAFMLAVMVLSGG